MAFNPETPTRKQMAAETMRVITQDSLKSPSELRRCVPHLGQGKPLAFHTGDCSCEIIAPQDGHGRSYRAIAGSLPKWPAAVCTLSDNHLVRGARGSFSCVIGLRQFARASSFELWPVRCGIKSLPQRRPPHLAARDGAAKFFPARRIS